MAAGETPRRLAALLRAGAVCTLLCPPILSCASASEAPAAVAPEAPWAVEGRRDGEAQRQTVDPVGSDPAPAWVLDGTDLVALEELEVLPLSRVPSGCFSAEQGGAEIELCIEAAAGMEGPAIWLLSRRYREPGPAPATKRYRLRRRGPGLSGEAVELRAVRDGLLLWERDSGVESIPADLWCLYRHGGPEPDR